MAAPFCCARSPRNARSNKFTQYTERWMLGPGVAEPDAPFHGWSGEHAPPSHSMPSAIVGKAVVHEFGAEGFDRFHLALMRAYFADNRTVSDRAVILDVAAAVELDVAALAVRFDRDDEALEAEVIADHKDALAHGIAAVPTVMVDDEYMLQGAMNLDQYRKSGCRDSPGSVARHGRSAACARCPSGGVQYRSRDGGGAVVGVLAVRAGRRHRCPRVHDLAAVARNRSARADRPWLGHVALRPSSPSSPPTSPRAAGCWCSSVRARSSSQGRRPSFAALQMTTLLDVTLIGERSGPCR